MLRFFKAYGTLKDYELQTLVDNFNRVNETEFVCENILHDMVLEGKLIKTGNTYRLR